METKESRQDRLGRTLDEGRFWGRTVLTGLGLAPSAPAGLFRGVSGLLAHRARRHPSVPALRTPDRELSYGDLNDAVNRAARVWTHHGVGQGMVIALQLANRVETIVHEFALARVGAAAALLAPDLSGPGLSHALSVCKARGMVGQSTAPPQAFSVPYWSLEALSAEAEKASSERVPDPLTRTKTVFCYLFTSGTTGLPKAAPVRHRRFLSGGYAFQSLALRLTPADTLFTPLPFHHASAQVIGLSAALWAGATFAFVPRFSARRYWASARAVSATAGLYIGELCRYLLNVPPSDADRDHGIRVFVGNGLRGDVWRPFQTRFGIDQIFEFYGATEGNAVLLNRNGKPGSCGQPLFHGPFDHMRLVRYDTARGLHPRDSRGRLVLAGPDEVGELIARISFMPGQGFDGYADSEATAAKILRDVVRRGDRWFRTGDLLRKDRDGDFFFVDRIGDTFRWKGENVSTEEVERVLRTLPLLGDLAVYGVEVKGHEGRAGMAAITGPRLDPEAVYQAIVTLPKHARPLFIRQVAQVQRTETQKIQRGVLRDEGIDPDRCGDDPLWVRDDATATYLPLTSTLRSQIANGTYRV